MGMFDTINVRCPVCDRIYDMQSKAGPCELDTYDIEEAPLGCVEGLNGESWDCECGNTIIITTIVSVTLTPVAMKVKEPENRS